MINAIQYQGQKTNSQAEVSELLNTFFVEIGPNLSRNVANVDTTYEEFLCATTKEFIFEKTTTAHILSLLSKLCKSKATGLDKISAKLLKECPDLIAESLTLIFNQSLSTGIFPDEWKSARVTPLYKNSGKRNDPTNYRPISVIPVVAKVFERVVYDQLYHYLTENCIISPYQSGFCSLHSTVTALLEATDSWAMNIDRILVNAVIFLDLKKAFDTVDRNILLTKLQCYELRSSCHEWFTLYLSNRTQTCLINTSMSTPEIS
ncbi:reverse transcriptase domain-containing protein [Candidatus Albibeggiatoa sp. nov. NOAA]|uniref:reverse transcriptase domain-containing protein n=1 Tax=Candidatus Albibeggiatoa sp. nov. NOAA TaxID=3162724 RepID=UPI003302DA70|nr:reverse transcriptase domain-containing protein [Thiotrichaceae bacterium]